MITVGFPFGYGYSLGGALACPKQAAPFTAGVAQPHEPAAPSWQMTRPSAASGVFPWAFLPSSLKTLSAERQVTTTTTHHHSRWTSKSRPSPHSLSRCEMVRCPLDRHNQSPCTQMKSCVL